MFAAVLLLRVAPGNGAITQLWQSGAGTAGRAKSRQHFSQGAAASTSGGGTAARVLTPPLSRAQLSSTTSQMHRQDSPLPPTVQQLQQPSQHSLEVTATTAAIAAAGAGSATASCNSAGAHAFARDTMSTATATSASATSMPVRFRSTDGYGAGSGFLERQAPSILEAVDESADGAAAGDALAAAEKAHAHAQAEAQAVPSSYSEGWQQQQLLVGDRGWQPPTLEAYLATSSRRSVNLAADAAGGDPNGGGREGSRTAPPLRERQGLLTLPAGPSRYLRGAAPQQDERVGLSSSVEAEVTVGPYLDAVGGASIESVPAAASQLRSGEDVSRTNRDLQLSHGGGTESAAASATVAANGVEAAAAPHHPADGPSFSGGRVQVPRMESSPSRPQPLLATQGTEESATSSPVNAATLTSFGQKRSASLAQALKKIHQQQQLQPQFSPVARLTRQTSPASPFSASRTLGQRVSSTGIALQGTLLQPSAAMLNSAGGAAGAAYSNHMRSMTQKAVSVSTWVTGFGPGGGAAAPDSLAVATDADVIAGARSSPAERFRFDGLSVGTTDKQQLQHPHHLHSTLLAKPSSALSFLQDDEVVLTSGGGGLGQATVEEMLRAQWVRLGAGGSGSVSMTVTGTMTGASAGDGAAGVPMKACAEELAATGSDHGSEVLGRERTTSPLPRRPASLAAAMGAPARGVSSSGGCGGDFVRADGGQRPYLPSHSLRLADDLLPASGDDAAAGAHPAPNVVTAPASQQASGEWQAAFAVAAVRPAGGATSAVAGPARPSLSQLQAAMASTSAVPTPSGDAGVPGSGCLLSQRPSWAAAAPGRGSARRASLDARMAAALEAPPPQAPSSALRLPQGTAGSVWSSGMVAVTTGGGYALGAGASHLPGVTPQTSAAGGAGGWAATRPVAAALSRTITQSRLKGLPQPSATLQPLQDGSAAGAPAAAAAAPAGGVVVFRGLRVRVGMSCGVLSESDVLRAPWKNARVQYSGLCMRLAKLVSDSALGGMTMLSESARAALESTMLAAPEDLEKVLRKHQPLLVWMGAHCLAPDLPPQQLYQLVSGALLPRLVLLSARPLRSLGVLPPLCGVLAAPARQAAAARLSVSGAATLLAWNAEVTARALALLHRVLLDLLREMGERVYVVEGADGWHAGGSGGGLGLSSRGASFQPRAQQCSEYGEPSEPHSLKSQRSQRTLPLAVLSPFAQQQLAPAIGRPESPVETAAAPVSAPLQVTPDGSFHGRVTGRSGGAQAAGGEGANVDAEGGTSQNMRSRAQPVLDGQQELPGQGQSQELGRGTAGQGPTLASGPLGSIAGHSGRFHTDSALAAARGSTAASGGAAPRGKQPAGQVAGSGGKQAAGGGGRQRPGVFTVVFEDANSAATFMLRALMVMPLLDW